MPENTRLAGHELAHEGAPHDDRGARLYRNQIVSTPRGGKPGRAKCSCGDVSHVLPSTTARRAWHREHKATVRAQAEAVAR